MRTRLRSVVTIPPCSESSFQELRDGHHGRASRTTAEEVRARDARHGRAAHGPGSAYAEQREAAHCGDGEIERSREADSKPVLRCGSELEPRGGAGPARTRRAGAEYGADGGEYFRGVLESAGQY